MRTYSPFFETLYDQPEPVGRLGRGTHYSVLRSLTWWTPKGEELPEAHYHDVVVVWDEDHDTRIVDLVVALYKKRLLSPVLFIGERKGTVSVIVDVPELSPPLDVYSRKVERVAQSYEDPWTASAYFWGQPTLLIHSEPHNVRLFLENARMLWDPGIKLIPAGKFDPLIA